MVNSLRKEFAPKGANSFLKEFTPFERALLPRKANRILQSLTPFEKMLRKHGSVPIHFNWVIACKIGTLLIMAANGEHL